MFAATPERRISDGITGLDEASLVALDLRRQPLRARLGPNHGENGRCFDFAALSGLRVFELDRFQFLPAEHSSNFCAIENLDVLLRLDPTRKIIRHPLGEIVAAHDEQHFGGAI